MILYVDFIITHFNLRTNVIFLLLSHPWILEGAHMMHICIHFIKSKHLLQKFDLMLTHQSL